MVETILAPSGPRPEPEVEEAATRRLAARLTALARGQPLERALVAFARAQAAVVAEIVLASGEPAESVEPLAAGAQDAALRLARRLVDDARRPPFDHAPELPR